MWQGEPKPRKAWILILVSKFETRPSRALLQVLASCSETETLWLGWEGWVCSVHGPWWSAESSHQVNLLLLARRNTLPGNMVFNLWCLPLKILSWCHLCSMNLKAQSKEWNKISQHQGMQWSWNASAACVHSSLVSIFSPVLRAILINLMMSNSPRVGPFHQIIEQIPVPVDV